MSYLTAERFIRSKGRKKLIQALAALNNGAKEKDLARDWGLSKARTSELCNKLFRREWVLAQSTRDALEFDLNRDRDEAKEIHQLIDPQPTHLRLVKNSDGLFDR